MHVKSLHSHMWSTLRSHSLESKKEGNKLWGMSCSVAKQPLKTSRELSWSRMQTFRKRNWTKFVDNFSISSLTSMKLSNPSLWLQIWLKNVPALNLITTISDFDDQSSKLMTNQLLNPFTRNLNWLTPYKALKNLSTKRDVRRLLQ